MSYTKIWIHAVWGTKNRYPFLTPSIRKKVIDHIKENAKKKSIYIGAINGVSDHLHCLISLNPEMSIAKAVQLIKGESAYWINKEKLTKLKFEWADEYYAASLSEAHLKRVKEYIANQEKHHTKKSYLEEVADIIEEHGLGAKAPV